MHCKNKRYAPTKFNNFTRSETENSKQITNILSLINLIKTK